MTILTATITIDFSHKFPGSETLEVFGHITCLDGDTVYSYELGVKTIQLLGVKDIEKGYLVGMTITNPGQYDNYATIHIYVIDDDAGTIRQLDDAYVTVEFGFECVGE